MSCSNAGVVCRWDGDEPFGGPIVVGPGALSAVVAVVLRNGQVGLVVSGTDGRLTCWDADTGAPIGRPEPPADHGVVSLATMPGPGGLAHLVWGGNDGSVTIGPPPWGGEARTSADALVDSTSVQDALGRRLLAVHLAGLLGGLAKNSDSTSAVVHVDGQWGSGKSTLAQLLINDKNVHGPDWTDPLVVNYEAWRECAIAPEWWSLSAAIARAVRASRSRGTRLLMSVWLLYMRTRR